MGCDIVVGRKDRRYGNPCPSRSKHAFGGSWHFTPAIGDASPGFRMLFSQQGVLELSDCIGAIEQMRVDLQGFENGGVPDFDPISADTEGKWGKKWRKRSRSQFLYLPLRDPSNSTSWIFTPSEVKTIIRAIVEAVDWAIARFGKDNVVLEIQ